MHLENSVGNLGNILHQIAIVVESVPGIEDITITARNHEDRPGSRAVSRHQECSVPEKNRSRFHNLVIIGLH